MKKKKNTWQLIGCVGGVLAVAMGIVVMTGRVSVLPRTAQFGADFYTEIYSVTRVAVLSTIHITRAIRIGLGSLLIAFGIFEVCYFGSRIQKKELSPVIGTLTAQEKKEQEIL